MSPELEIVNNVMLEYAKLWQARYKVRWMPKDKYIRDTLDILKSPLPGFEPYKQEDLIRRVNAFFNCREDWLISCKYNYEVFIKHIHRWISDPAKVPASPVSLAGTPSYRCDCGRVVQSDQICADCFPICNQCGRQHLIEESCEECEKRMIRLQKLFNGDENKHANKTVTISGENAFDEKKKFVEKDGKMMRKE